MLNAICYLLTVQGSECSVQRLHTKDTSHGFEQVPEYPTYHFD
jgi:hypothetical protein